MSPCETRRTLKSAARLRVECVGDAVAWSWKNQLERARYSAYGVAFGIGAADQNLNGTTDAGDYFAWTSNYNAGSPLADSNFDGVVDGGDFAAWTWLSVRS